MLTLVFFFLPTKNRFSLSSQLQRGKIDYKTEGKRVSITVINFVRFLARFGRLLHKADLTRYDTTHAAWRVATISSDNEFIHNDDSSG